MYYASRVGNFITLLFHSFSLTNSTYLISPGKDFIFLIPVEKMALCFVTGRSPSLQSPSDLF